MAFTFSSGQFRQWDEDYAAELAHKDQMNFRRAANAIADERGPVRNVGLLNPQGAMASIAPVGVTPVQIAAAQGRAPVKKPVVEEAPKPEYPTSGVAIRPEDASRLAYMKEKAERPDATPEDKANYQHLWNKTRGMYSSDFVLDPPVTEQNPVSPEMEERAKDAAALQAAREAANRPAAPASAKYTYTKLRREMLKKYGEVPVTPGIRTVETPTNKVPAKKPEKKAGVVAPTKTEKAARKVIAKEVGVSKMPAGPTKQVLTSTTPRVPQDMTRINVQLLNEELQRAVVARQSLFDLADIYKRAGMGAKYLEAEGVLNDMTVTVRNLAQQKAINIFENGRDPRMLQQMWAQQAGKPITITPRADGLWNITSGNQMLYEGVSTEAIASSARSSASQAYVTGINSAAAERVAKRDEARWSMEEKVLVESIKAANAKEIKQMELDGKIQVGADGEIYIVRGNNLIQYREGEAEGPDGEEVPTLDMTTAPIPTRGSMSSIMQQAWDRVKD